MSYADYLPGCYYRDPWCKLIWVVSNQPICGGEEEVIAGCDGIFLQKMRSPCYRLISLLDEHGVTDTHPYHLYHQYLLIYLLIYILFTVLTHFPSLKNCNFLFDRVFVLHLVPPVVSFWVFLFLKYIFGGYIVHVLVSPPPDNTHTDMLDVFQWDVTSYLFLCDPLLTLILYFPPWYFAPSSSSFPLPSGWY